MSDKTEQLIASLAGEAVAVRPVTMGAVCARWMAGFVSYVAILVAITGVRPDFAELLHHPLFVGEIGLLAALVISSALTAALLSFPDRYQQRWLLRLPLVLFVAFAGVLIAEWLQHPIATPFTFQGAECLTCITAYALVPGAWLLWQMRKLASTHADTAGAAAVMASFAMGAMALRLKEPTDSIAHLVQWHYVPMLAAALIGLGLGKRLLKW